MAGFLPGVPFYSALGERRLSLAFAHHVDEAAEEVVAVLRAGRGFRVVLDGKDRLARDAQTAIASVEQRNMSLLNALRQGLRVHRERSEEHTSELQSLMRNSYAV